MSDHSADHDDILTGRRPRGQQSRRPQPDTSVSETTSTSRSGRSRRRFTVDALFTDTRPQAVGVEDLPEAKEIRLDRIVPDPDQPRRTFDEVRLEELAASVRSDGVLQPIVVRYQGEGDRYVIVHGERRFRASQMANRTSIPALVRDVPEERRLIQQLMENIARDDLNAVDRARALRTLKARMNDAPWEDVAAEVGIRRSRLFQLLDTAKLPDVTQDQIRSGALSEKQSRAVQGLPAIYQEALGSAIVERAVPGAIVQRIGRAIRGSARQVTTLEDAKEHVGELFDLAIAVDDTGRAAQIDRLLAHLNAGIGESTADRLGLKEIATTLGAPSYSPARVTKAVGDLAQSLARSDEAGIRKDRELTARLASLRDILDRLIADP